MLRRLLMSMAGVVAVLCTLEALLRMLPVSSATLTGYHFDSDLLTYPGGHAWTVSTGWDLRNPQRMRSNNWGFASQTDFVADPSAIALIGDSYVEASMLDATDRPAAQLQARLGQTRAVYGLGSPGTALLDYAQRIRFASQKLRVKDFVVWLEPGDARQALCGSGNVHSRCLDPRTLEPRVERQPSAPILKRIARNSALAQYLVSQLKVDAGKLAATVLVRRTPMPGGGAAPAMSETNEAAFLNEVELGRSKAVVDAAVSRFFDDAQPYLVGRLLFVVDGQRTRTAAAPKALDLERQYLIERLRARGVQVIDLESIYAANATRPPISMEVGPYDRHLNKFGVGLVASEVASVVRRWQ